MKLRIKYPPHNLAEASVVEGFCRGKWPGACWRRGNLWRALPRESWTLDKYLGGIWEVGGEMVGARVGDGWYWLDYCKGVPTRSTLREVGGFQSGIREALGATRVFCSLG